MLIYAAICFFMLLGFVGLALDTAFVRSTTQELQHAADAAALAGCEILDTGNAGNQFGPVRQAAVDCAVANTADNDGVQIDHNYGNGPAGDVVVGVWDPVVRTFTPETTACKAVQVRARRTSGSAGGPVDLLFGGIFGTNQSELSRNAIAIRGTAGAGAVVLVLDPFMPKAFDMRGTSTMLAMSGIIQVNSAEQTQAFYLNGAPEVARARAQAIHVTGVSKYPEGATAPIPKDGMPPIPDPLAGLPYPDTGSMPNLGGITGPGAYPPGYYPDGIDANDGPIIFSPGVYVFGAPVGIDLHGDANVIADDVMIFLEEGAQFKISGNDAGMQIVAPSSGVFQGVAIFAHRMSTATFDISGSGVFDLRGVLYLAGGHLEMDGVVDRKIGRIIVNSLQFRGVGVYHITGEGPPDNLPLSTYLVK